MAEHSAAMVALRHLNLYMRSVIVKIAANLSFRMNERNELADLKQLPEFVYQSARRDIPDLTAGKKRAASEE